jgi:hypothetical protein
MDKLKFKGEFGSLVSSGWWLGFSLSLDVVIVGEDLLGCRVGNIPRDA